LGRLFGVLIKALRADFPGARRWRGGSVGTAENKRMVRDDEKARPGAARGAAAARTLGLGAVF